MMFKNLDGTGKLALPLFLPIFALDAVLSLLATLLRQLFGRGGGPPKDGMQSVAVADAPASATHGAPRRSPAVPRGGELVSSVGATTLAELVGGAADKYAGRVAMRHFEFLELKKKRVTDRFPTKFFGDELVEVTYRQLGESIDRFGRGLRAVGMEPQPDRGDESFDDLKGKFTLVIFEETCKEWTIALQGAMSQSMVVATCYATLGEDAVVSAVNETGASALMVNWKNAEKFHKMAGKMPSLKTIVASTNEVPKAGAQIFEAREGEVKVVSFDDLLDLGGASSFRPAPPKPTDVAVIMYTSGSTGKPKGVVMEHRHLVAGLAGMSSNVSLRAGEEVYVSYLPLAHILALQIESQLLSEGATVCYTDPRQLPIAMPRFRPTLFAGVPKVWEVLRTGLEKNLKRGPAPLRIAFGVLVSWKIRMLSLGMDTPVSNAFFGMISSRIFGRKSIRFGVSGGGPMSESLQLFCRAVFNCPIIQGYALTETCVGGCFQATWDQRPGVVGPPVPCVEVVLQSEPEITDHGGLPYLATDTRGADGEAVIGRGEICLRGPCISSGYYKLPDKTREDYDVDGFFHTGDIGQFTADGCIKIVDRKKNLVKLKGGEYVAIEAMEAAFSGSQYIAFLCVIANGDLDGPLAVAVADNAAIAEWADGAGVRYESVHALAETDAARKEVVRSFVECGRAAGLGKLELRIKDVALVTDDEWKPGHGLTASMKLDRKGILRIHKDKIDAMYKRQGVVISG